MRKKEVEDMQKEFSLILPVYNVAPYLERCLLSILSQDLSGCEIILVDDGATDASPAICDDYASRYQEIKVIHQPNGGLASARNTGLQAASGRYVWFIDSDDWIVPDALSVLRAACSGGHDVVKFAYQRVEGEQVRPVSHDVAAGDYEGDALEKIRHLAFCAPGRFLLSAWGHVYRRDFLMTHDLRFVSGVSS